MQHTIQDYELVLIDDPLQSHVVAWEKASRALKSEDAKPMLADMQAAFSTVDVSNLDLRNMLEAFIKASTLLKRAIQILEQNETLTTTANHGVFLKAALEAGWVVSFTKANVPILKTPEEVDYAKPWLIHWAAECIAQLYLEATTIPKN
jgi:hypothetical protein